MVGKNKRSAGGINNMTNEEGEKKGLVGLIRGLIKNIDELREEHQTIKNQVLITRKTIGETENIEDLRLICTDISATIEHIIDKDAELFGFLDEMMKVELEVFTRGEHLMKLMEGDEKIEKKEEEQTNMDKDIMAKMPICPYCEKPLTGVGHAFAEGFSVIYCLQCKRVLGITREEK